MFGYAQGKSERLHASSKPTESYDPQHSTPTQSKDFPPYMMYEGLASFLQSLHGKSPSPSLSELEQGKQKVEPHNHVLLVVLAFDEAHTTTQQHQATGEEWSVFNKLCHALQRFRAAHRSRSRWVTGTVNGCRTRTVEDPGACVWYGVRQNRHRTDPSLDGRLRPSYGCTVSQIQVRHRGHKFLKEDVSRCMTCMCHDTLLILGSILRCTICLPPPFFFVVTIATTRDFAQSCQMYEKCISKMSK